MNVQSFGNRHRGRRRNNEDFVAWFEPTEPAEIESSGFLYILADGVGGAAKGERASQYAAEKVRYEFYQHQDIEPGERLRQLMTRANDDIYSHAEQSGSFKRMATTMVAAVVRAGKLIVANVGDSRAYLIREGVSSQLTRDHSLVGEMVASGEMTEAEAQVSKIKNRITRSIGGEAEVHVDVLPPISLQAGDKILLCSDGLTRYALREDIAKMTAEGSPQEIVERLIKFANKRGGADNVSAILISYGAPRVFKPVGPGEKLLPPPTMEDTLDTIPGILPRRKKATIPIILVILFLGIFGVLTFGVVTGISTIIATPQQTVTLYPATGALTSVLITTVSPNPVISETLQTATETPTVTQTETTTALQTEMQTLTGSPTLLITQTEALQTAIDCYYTIAPGDNLYNLAEKFKIGGSNWKMIVCADDDQRCILSDPGNITPGWTVKVPNVMPETCTSNGGRLTLFK